MEMTTVIAVNDLEKVYATGQTEVVALQKVSFCVCRGDIVGLIGNNGAGKTTTLHVLLNLIPESSGTCDVFLDRANKSMWDSVSFVPEDNIFPGHLSGVEYCKLMYMLRNNKSITNGEILNRLRAQGLVNEDTVLKRISTYSKGNKRMLGVAESLLYNPELVVLDEPFEGLDPHNQALLEGTIRRYSEENEVTFLVSTHSIDKVKSMCTRVVFLKRGKIVLDADVKELKDSPEKLRGLYENPS